MIRSEEYEAKKKWYLDNFKESYGIEEADIIVNVNRYNTFDNDYKSYVSIYVKSLDVGFSCGTRKSQFLNLFKCYDMLIDWIPC